MRVTARLVLAAAGALLLCSHAAGQDTRFTKKGATAAVEKRDSAQCWRLAQKAKLTKEQADQNLLTGYLVGGVVGVLIASSANEEANKEPKSAFRRQVHDDCMAKRGYKTSE